MTGGCYQDKQQPIRVMVWKKKNNEDYCSQDYSPLEVAEKWQLQVWVQDNDDELHMKVYVVRQRPKKDNIFLILTQTSTWKKMDT